MWYNKPGFSKEVGIDAKGFLVDKDKGVRNVTLKTGDQVIPHEGDSLNVFYPHPRLNYYVYQVTPFEIDTISK